MEKESSERGTDGITDTEEENPEGDMFSGRPSSAAECLLRETGRTEEGFEQLVLEEDITAYLEHDPQDPPNLAAPQDPGAGEAKDCETAEAKEDEEEEEEEDDEGSLGRDGVEDQRAAGHEEIMDEDEEDGQEESQNEDGRDEHMNGESGWRSSGNGKRCRSRNSGGAPVLEPSSLSSSAISSSIQKGNLLSGGGRHKPRRRNHHHHQGRGRRRTGNQLASAFRELLSDSLGTWCISCIHMVIELIVTLTHHCGVGVEAGGVALYGFGSQLFAKVTDVPGMKADARRVLDWTRGTGAVLVDKSVKTAEYVKQASLTCFGVFCTLALLGFHWARGALTRLSGERGKRCWRALQDSRVWRTVASLLERVGAWFKRRNRAPPSGPESPGGAGRWLPGQDLERLLALALVPEDELDPFTVLGVEVHATEAELKRAYRQLAVQVHPDKNKHPRAGEAFKVLRAAWDIVSNPDTRREYELKRMAASELSKSMNEFLTKLQDDLKEAMNTMMCTKCEGKHKRFEIDREPAEARFCAECNRRHSAEEGDLWAESSMLGLRITYFACMDCKVYDITEWAGCQRIGISPDTHRVPYHISFGSKNNSTSTRQRTPSEQPSGPSNPADLQDFFNRIFQGGPATDMAANGGFFPSGPPHSQPPGAAGPRFPPPPPPQTGFFMPGAPRSEPGETFAGEGGKPPRRRKKVRKPFQRSSDASSTSH